MKKKTKNYSIIIVSDAQSSSKEFVISRKFILRALIASIALILVFGVIIFDYLTMSFDREKLNSLQKEIKEKQQENLLLTQSLKSIEKKVSQISQFEKRLKVATGLTSPYSLKEVGSGGEPIQVLVGSEVPNAVTNQNLPVSNNVLNKARSINNKTDQLLNSLKFVDSFVDKQKIRLAHFPMRWPTRGYLTDQYGWRTHPITGKRDFHQAVDISTQLGNKVYAPASGIVLVTSSNSHYGNYIVIDHSYEYSTRYGHLAKIAVKEGQKVKRGDVIGYVGSTGMSNAPHLHYEVRFMDKPLNPLKFLVIDE